MGFFDKLTKVVSVVNDVTDTVAETKPVYDENGAELDKSAIITKFDLSALKKADNHFYLLIGENRSIFTADALDLNRFLREASRQDKGVPSYEIAARDLVFTPQFDNGTRRNTILSFSPMTKTGRPPKYPVKVHFAMDAHNFFGTAYYGHSKEIEKAEIIMWRSHIGYIIMLALIDGKLALKGIVRSDPDGKHKMFQR